MAPKGTKTIFHNRWNLLALFFYSFRANRRAIGHAECSRTPSPQSASRQSPSGLLWEHECSVVASSAVASHCPLGQWSSFRVGCVCLRQKQWTQWDVPEGENNKKKEPRLFFCFISKGMFLTHLYICIIQPLFTLFISFQIYPL